MKPNKQSFRAIEAWNKKMLWTSGFIGLAAGGLFNYLMPNGDGVWTGFNGGIVTTVVLLGLYFGVLRRSPY